MYCSTVVSITAVLLCEIIFLSIFKRNLITNYQMKKTTCILLALMTSASLWADNSDGNIKGKLLESGTEKVIDYADLFLYKNGVSEKPVMQTFPNEKGEFIFNEVENGTYTLMVRLIGYDIVTVKDIVINNEDKYLGNLSMKPLEMGISEVEVVASKRQLVYKLDKKIVEASANMMAGGGSAVDILENTPSIRVDAEGEVTFRGSSGFLVYVDGKPSVFSGTQALEHIPAGQIENIEIITTPSAKHDSDGDVGIINIITKKHSQQGLSGMVNLSGSTWLSRNIDFLLTKQNTNSRWYVGGQWTDRLRKSDFDQEKMTIVGDQTTTSHSVGPRTGDNYNYSLKGGWSIELPKTSISVDVEGGYGGNKRKGEMNYKETRSINGSEPQTEYYRSIDDYDNSEKYGLGSFALKHRFNDNGHELSASAYYKYGGDALEYFFNDLMSLEGKRVQGHRAYEAEHRETLRANLDYTLPINETARLEAGYQYYSYLEDGDYKMEWWNPQGEHFYWRDDIYNTFYFQEGVNSIYAILAKSWNRFDVQAGVRGEHTHTVLRSSVEGADRTKNRFELFPSAHVGYDFPGEHHLQASFSRRTTRPQLFYMEPYITYRDFYTAEIGNPDIRPEYINSYELNYRKDFGENQVSVTAFHRSRKDKIERLRVPFEAGVTLDSMANVGHDYSTGLELSVNLRPFKFWGTTVNGSLYHYKVKNERAAGGNTATSTNYDILWNNLFDVAKYTRLQFDASFVGPSVTTQGRTDAYWYANMAIRQQLFGRRLTASLVFRDIFRTAKYISDIQTSDLRSLTRIKPKYPQIMLTLSWTFNSFSGKTSGSKEDRMDMFEGIKH